MGTVIAFNGKGGTGKSTIAAMLVEHLAGIGAGSILAIDADPNSNLPELLGVAKPKTIVGMVDEISKNLDKIPGGMTKDRFVEMRVQEEGITEAKGFDLLVMGRPEGPGCYCYVNNLLRDIIGRITKSYDIAVIDNAAGMEHISRRTERAVDRLVLVSDYSIFGVRSAARIYGLAKELGIKIGKTLLMINKVTGSLKAIEGEIKQSGLEIAGTITYDEEVAALGISSKSVFSLKDNKVKETIGDIWKSIKPV